MTVSAIWRYPVKSMAGERLDCAALTSGGLPGDRVVQVYDGRGRLVTARAFPRLRRLRATLSLDGEPLVDGLPWQSPTVAARVEAAVGPAGSPVLTGWSPAGSSCTGMRFAFPHTAWKSVSANPACSSIHWLRCSKPAGSTSSRMPSGSYLYELSVQIVSPSSSVNVRSASAT